MTPDSASQGTDPHVAGNTAAQTRATGRLSALQIGQSEAAASVYKNRKSSRRLVVGYLFFAVIWIIFSDLAVQTWISDPALQARAQTFKGIFFVAGTAALLIYLLVRHFEKLRRVEEKLHERDSHVGHIIDTMANGVALIDLDGTIVDANPALADLFDRPRRQIVGQPLAGGGLPDEARQDFPQTFLDKVRRLGQWSGEVNLEDSQGQPFPAHLTLAPLYDDRQRLTGYVGDYLDLRDARTAEARLHGLGAVIEQLATETDLNILGERALESAIDLTDAACGSVVLLDDSAGCLSHRWHQGLTAGDADDAHPSLAARMIEDPTPRIIDDRSSIAEQLPRFPCESTTAVAAVPITVRDVPRGALLVATGVGDRSFIDDHLRLLKAVARQIGVAIHRQELLEDARESEARFRNVVNTVPDILYSTQLPDLITTFISPSVERTLGVSADEMLANPAMWRDLIHDADRPDYPYTAEYAPRIVADMDASTDEADHYVLEYRCWNAERTRYFWFEDHGQIERNDQGEPIALTGVISDITARKHAEERLAFLAFHDRLTGLPNRLGFLERLADFDDCQGILLYCDLDRFHLINDIHGHASGNALLEETANRLQKTLPEPTVLARMGADEFVAFVPVDQPPGDEPPAAREEILQDQSRILALEIMTAFQRPFAMGEQDVYLSTTIGISLLTDPAEDGSMHLKNAHRALAHAKDMGSANFAFYAGELASRQRRRLSLQSRIHRGLERDEFELYYQPIVDLHDGSIRGAEALLRWTTSDGESISPGEFIPVAEQSGLIIPLGEWVLHQGCKDLRAWLDAGLDLSLSLNLSPRQFFHADVVNTILTAAKDAGVTPEQLELELTESALLVDPEQTGRILHRLRLAGFPIAIDDFGTGYSSLERLKKLPVETLKIDRSFVSDLPDATRDVSIVRTVINLAQNFQMVSLAEGIETRQQWKLLLELGCNRGQGYFFGRPLPADDFFRLCQKPLAWQQKKPSSSNG